MRRTIGAKPGPGKARGAALDPSPMPAQCGAGSESVKTWLLALVSFST